VKKSKKERRSTDFEQRLAGQGATQARIMNIRLGRCCLKIEALLIRSF
jgi:hypothetical protein